MEKDADDDDDVAEELKQDFVDEETGEAPRRSYTDSQERYMYNSDFLHTDLPLTKSKHR